MGKFTLNVRNTGGQNLSFSQCNFQLSHSPSLKLNRRNYDQCRNPPASKSLFKTWNINFFLEFLFASPSKSHHSTFTDCTLEFLIIIIKEKRTTQPNDIISAWNCLFYFFIPSTMKIKTQKATGYLFNFSVSALFFHTQKYPITVEMPHTGILSCNREQLNLCSN